MANIQDARTVKLESDRLAMTQELSLAEMETIVGGLRLRRESSSTVVLAGKKVVCSDLNCNDGCCLA